MSTFETKIILLGNNVKFKFFNLRVFGSVRDNKHIWDSHIRHLYTIL